jgi:zinc protease
MKFLSKTLPCVAVTAVLGSFLSSPVFAANDTPAGYTLVRTEQGVSEYRLDSNGLTVLLQPDSSAPAVTILVTYRVGSRNESYGTTGATHLLEHLMFKGTTVHNKEAGNGFDQLLEKTGAITNATTSQDRTNYFETVGTQDLELAVMLEADRMRNLRLREEDRRPEMTVVRNEYERGENSPAEALDKEIWATAYLAHPYHHSTIGWRSDFEKVPITKLRNFYDTFYWPNNSTVTISGDFQPAKALELTKKYYGAIPRSPRPIPEVYTEEPPQTGPRRVVVKRPGELGIVTIAQKIPQATNADFAALKVLGEILSDGRNSRFYLGLTDKNLTSDVDASPNFNHDATLLSVVAQLAPNAKHEDVEKQLLEEIEHLQKDGVTPEEVKQAISKLTASTAYSRDGSFARASELSECIAAGDWRLYNSLDEAVKKVTPADVERVAKKYFKEDQRVTGWFIPQDDAAPDSTSSEAGAQVAAAEPSPVPEGQGSPDVRAASTAGKQLTAPRPKGNELQAAAPRPTQVAPHIKRTRTEGIDLLVCPTGVKDVVTINGILPAFDPANPILGPLVADMLDRGTRKHDAREIAKLLDEVGAQVDFHTDSGCVKFAVKCLKKDSQHVIDLLAEQLREPSFPADEFEKMKKLKLAEAQRLREDTDAQASIAFRRATYPPGNPMYRLTSDESIAAIEKTTNDDLQQFYKHWFGPEHCVMVVVGDVEAKEIQSQVSKSFSGWTGGLPLPAFSEATPVKSAELLVRPIPGKESVNVIMGAPSGLHRTDRDYLPLDVGTSVLGHGFTSRLTGHVRDTEGLTYGISSDLIGTGPIDQAWLIVATFAPSLLDQGLKSTHRELNEWYSNGITAAELDYRKSALTGEHYVKMATTGGMADTILETVRDGLDLSWIDEYPKQLAALTLDQVNNAIRKHVNPEKLITVEAGTLEAKSK